MVIRTSELPVWKWALLVLAAFLPLACATERLAEPAAPRVAYEMQTIERTLRDCPENLAPCASIALEYPKITDAPTAEAHANIDAYIRSLVLAPLEEGNEDATAEDLMERFLGGYREFAEDFPEQSSQWVMTRRAEPIHNAHGVFSVEFTEDSYTGGAHPNSSVALVSFDANSGQRLLLDDLFVEGYSQQLTAIAERAFRAERNLTAAEDLSGAGFWFENGVFRLNDNFAVVPEGLKFYFNPYEVGPYSMGPTTIVLGTESLAALIRPEGILAPSVELAVSEAG